MSDLVWLIPLLPLVAGVVGVLLPLSARRLAFVLATGALATSCVCALALLWHVLSGGRGAPELTTIDWLTFGHTSIELGFIVDPLTAVMVAMVTFVGLLIFIYSHGYMAHDPGYARFYSFLALFCAGMLGVCVADSLVLLFISWELVGVCSYLLIGFWFHKPSAAAAAKKAFLVTKLGDMGLFAGILLLVRHGGTALLYAHGGTGLLEPASLTTLAGAHVAGGTGIFGGLTLAGGLALLVFCGAVGKSGQFPLHVWLPDAMEGPTPVSALIHAATMVAAGVFLVARMYPLFSAGPTSLEVVAWLGGFTALLAATIAVAQRDIKRILAYSTVSQLGFMMLGLGAGGVVVGMFHLITHAFFKALLFLGAGSVIHGMHEEQDIMKMGGLRKVMPVTFLTYLCGTAALAGVVPFAGFWSKDAILSSARHFGAAHGAIGYAPFVMAVLASFLTAFYMTRQVLLVFFGESRSDKHAHESPAVMTLPLVVLAIFAAGLGFIGTPWADKFGAFLSTAAGAAAPAAEEANIGFMAAATALALAGIGCGWLAYGRRALKAGDADPLAGLPLWGALERRWYFDEIYAATVVRAVFLLASAAALLDAVVDWIVERVAAVASLLSNLTRWLDDHAVRPGARAVAWLVTLLSRGLHKAQSGRVQDYLSAITLGATLLVGLALLVLFSR